MNKRASGVLAGCLLPCLTSCASVDPLPAVPTEPVLPPPHLLQACALEPLIRGKTNWHLFELVLDTRVVLGECDGQHAGLVSWVHDLLGRPGNAEPEE